MSRNKSILFILFCTALFLCITGAGSSASAQTCTDNDGDTYAIEGGVCGAVDCDDNDPNVHPGAAEVCDGKDTNCDWWKPPTDVDNDGDGVPLCANDCDDNNPDTYPGAVEICDGIDNNCDYIVPINERDIDGDSYLACDVIPDCDDNDPLVNPGLQEFCSDGKDNNCNGTVDEQPCICPDNDNDGFTASYCGGTDCDDSSAAVYPGAAEICTDGLDNDCDGLVDIQDPDAINCPVCTDNDGDTYYIEGGGCGPVDCDDNDPGVHPGAVEICDGKDTNCDGWKPPTDVDNDADGVPLCANDCDDNNPLRFPGNIEVCDDGIDNDCDYLVDTADPHCQFTCNTKTSPKNGPHMFNLLNPADDSLISSSCNWCHYDETGTIDERTECQRCHADPADTSDPLNGVLKSMYPAAPPYGFGTALNVQLHSSTVVGTKYGSWDMSCLNCHNPHTQEQDGRYGTAYGKYIKEYVCYDNIVTSAHVEEVIEFTSNTGGGSFADGPPYNENICNMCHTQTNHHQSNGTAPGGQDHYNGQDCMTCHSHTDGFAPTGGIPEPPHDTIEFQNNCDYCHVTPTDFSTPVPDSKCDQCHTPAGVLKPQFPLAPDVVTHSDVDGSGKYTYTSNCRDCHLIMTPTTNLKLVKTDLSGSGGSANIVFTARTGTGSFADGPPYTENVCNTCHTMTNHHQNDGTAPGGQDHYNGTDCMTCHAHDASFLPTGATAVPPHDTITNCDYCHVNATDFTTPVPDSKCEQCHTPAGILKPQYPTAPDVLGHTGANGSGKYVYTNACIDCHDPMYGSTNLSLVRTQIPNSVIPGSIIDFTAYTGTGSFADGPPYNENVCNTCHSFTNHHQADGTAPGGQDHNNGTDCRMCHMHSDAYLPSGDCLMCHNQTQPAGSGDYRRQVVDEGGDIDTGKTSHHVQYSALDALTCEICHDQTNHMYNAEPGVLLNDPDGGASIAYSGIAGELTPFCLNCHDSDAANGNLTPFADSGDNTTPPDVAAEYTLAYGHGAVACMDCHGDSGGAGGATDPIINAHGSDSVRILNNAYDPANQLGYCAGCHGGSGTWGLDVSLEFDPANNARHPIGSPLTRNLTNKQLTGGWTPGDTMTCSDCHDTAGGATGPHGSAVKWMLAGANQAWPYVTSADNGSTSGTFATLKNPGNDLFCRNCHPDTGKSGNRENKTHEKGDHKDTECVGCHIRVPHGGSVSSLINADNNGNLPARLYPDGNGGGTVYVRKFTRASSPTNYRKNNCYSTNGACRDHKSMMGGGESW